MVEAETVLELKGVSKNFGRQESLSQVSFALRGGEVLGVLGDNGAGKSTLIKVITGIHPPSCGQMYVNQQLIDWGAYTPQMARKLGIQTVYQDLSLIEGMSILRNFFLGAELRRGWRLDWRRMYLIVSTCLSKMGLKIS